MTDIVPPKRKRGRPATGRNPPINLRAEPKLLKVIDAVAAGRGDTYGRSAAIRFMLYQWIEDHGAEFGLTKDVCAAMPAKSEDGSPASAQPQRE